MLNDCIDFKGAFFFFPACVPQAESLIYWCTEASGFIHPCCGERKGIRSSKEHGDISQSRLLNIQSQPVVQRHYHHKTPLYCEAIWAGIAIAWWKLQCFPTIDFRRDGRKENLVQAIIKRETRWDSYEERTHRLQPSEWLSQVPSGLHEALPLVFSLLVPVMDIGLIHYGADCHCDFCHSFPAALGQL